MCNHLASDSCRYHPDYGVLEVSKERWKESQFFEYLHWEQNRDDNDRSYLHERNFQNYLNLTQYYSSNSVSTSNLGDVLEIGAGPYTQIKSILDVSGLSFNSITLLEPQIMKYMGHVSTCTYKDGKIAGKDISFLVSGAETLMVGEIFDTVIMINTIEHVQNALLVLRNVYNAIKPGGTLIFHEIAYESYMGEPYSYHQNLLDFIFHPIRIKYSYSIVE
jgi:2-polyprenyl-3-methyl-5-hydroxy-6-metoxy-1,4-benzoquinol methylase